MSQQTILRPARTPCTNLYVVVDTDLIGDGGAQVPPGAPDLAGLQSPDPLTWSSQLPALPAGGACAIVTGGRRLPQVASIAGVDTLSLVARKGDQVRIFLHSGSYGFDDGTLLVALVGVSGDTVVDLQFEEIERSAVLPCSEDEPVPCSVETRTFSFGQGAVQGLGSQTWRLVFALYRRDEEDQPVYAGTWRWDFQLRVRSR